MTFLYYGGTAADGDPYIQLYVNGMVVAAGQFGGLQLSGPYKMPTATGNLQIGSYLVRRPERHGRLEHRPHRARRRSTTLA